MVINKRNTFTDWKINGAMREGDGVGGVEGNDKMDHSMNEKKKKNEKIVVVKL